MPTQTFNTSGTWQSPAGVTEVVAECWGGGGAGDIFADGGAGGGAYARKTLTVVPLDTYTVTVGAGGEVAGQGGSSWFISDTDVLANGAASALFGPSTGGSEGSSIGDFKFSGGDGDAAGGGGGSAFSNAPGGNGSGTTGGQGEGDGGNLGQPGQAPGGGSGGNGGDGAAGRVVLTWTAAATGIGARILGLGVTSPGGARSLTINPGVSRV